MEFCRLSDSRWLEKRAKGDVFIVDFPCVIWRIVQLALWRIRKTGLTRSWLRALHFRRVSGHESKPTENLCHSKCRGEKISSLFFYEFSFQSWDINR